MARTKSSKRWLNEHFDDHWVKQAQQAGYRSRAAFKLIEIDQKDQLIRPGMVVIDLGAAPGGWSQIVAPLVGNKGLVFALDILPMQSLAGVEFIQGDFSGDEFLQQLEEMLQKFDVGNQNKKAVDLVLSDMAPNISGMDAIDQPRAMHLAELAADFALQHLRPGGDFLVKVFQGQGFDEYLRGLRAAFNKVITRKPKASRQRSREVYLLAKGRRRQD
ncbi:MAG: 23S rRNA (uridine(2552)-2'-O)-methyltransferase RlmE [Xanthomonadales bacterium]|nr:23S rRNA (uridine(2552)-2'-O)-methyltransferase RlmE [Xanthomonadales bacterium]